MKETKKIRHEVYNFLKLDEKQKAYLSEAFNTYDDAKVENLREISRKYNFTQEKVSGYLKKARGIKPLTPELKAQIKALEFVSTWLNKNAE